MAMDLKQMYSFPVPADLIKGVSDTVGAPLLIYSRLLNQTVIRHKVSTFLLSDQFFFYIYERS